MRQAREVGTRAWGFDASAQRPGAAKKRLRAAPAQSSMCARRGARSSFEFTQIPQPHASRAQGGVASTKPRPERDGPAARVALPLPAGAGLERWPDAMKGVALWRP